MARNKETTDQAKSSKDPKKSRRSTSSNKSKKSANILPKDDPNFMREKNRYESPIASREYIINLIDKSSGNLNFEQISQNIKVKSNDQIEALTRRLKAMVRDGQLFVKVDKSYSTSPGEDELEGIVKLNEQQQGCLEADLKNVKVKISTKHMRGLFVGDKISAKLIPSKDLDIYKTSEVKVLERAVHECEGQYVQVDTGGMGYVIPSGKHSHQQILILPENKKSASQHDLVKVKITIHPTEKTPAIGVIKEVLPQKSLVDILIGQLESNFPQPEPWNKKALKGVEKQQSASKKWRWAKKVLSDDSARRDLRKLPFMTIDGADARDFDDAIYCHEKPAGGWELYVAIADVSYFVDKDDPLDIQAKDRATSIYFPGRVIPMLPEGLSNDLCSLVPGEDRLTLVCQMQVSAGGELETYEFYPAIIHSQARLTYMQAWKHISSGKSYKDKQIDTSLRHSYALHRKAMQARIRSGALTLELPEEELMLNNHGEIDKINSLDRNGAHVMIESCMLLANISAARFLEENKIPGLYRVHEPPKDEKRNDLILFLRHRGFKVPNKLTVKDISEVLLKAAKMPDFNLIQMFVLRSMTQAVYHTKNQGHFGLGFTEYTHFTSPIRRYPDLIVHRLIKSHVYSKKPTYNLEQLNVIAQSASQKERVAEDYSRKVTNALKCHYLKHYLGQKHKAVIASVLPFGFFAQLEEIRVDGMVHISNLQDDYYIYDQLAQKLVGEHKGKVYSVGDEILIRISKVDLELYRVDFQLVGTLKS